MKRAQPCAADSREGDRSLVIEGKETKSSPQTPPQPLSQWLTGFPSYDSLHSGDSFKEITYESYFGRLYKSLKVLAPCGHATQNLHLQ